VTGGLVTLATLSPAAEARAEGSLTAHMVQHVVLLVIAAPFLAASRRPASGATPLPASALFAAAGLHAGLMVAWHLPRAFDAAERTVGVHVLEHVSLLATAVAFWWAVGLGSRPPHRLSVLAIFASSMAGVGLGAAMTLAATPWYAHHRALSDQQVAGVVMWAFAGLAYLGLGILLFVRSLGGDEPGPRLAPALAPSTMGSST
jgi:cytochrome c oxidase assembly factor CtaG